MVRSVFSVPEAVEIPEDLTAEKTLSILREMVAGMEKAMSDMLSHARSEGITDAMKAMEEFQPLYIEHVEQMTQAQMKANGISQQVWLTTRPLKFFSRISGFLTCFASVRLRIAGFHGCAAEIPHRKRAVPARDGPDLRSSGEGVRCPSIL